MLNTALRVESASDAEIIPILEASIARVQALGGDAKESIEALELSRGGEFDRVRRGAKNLVEVGIRQGDIKAPAGQQQSLAQKEFNALTSSQLKIP